jgi:pyruvate/2-oxoglutarate dehydrogenase complex dihydrolipoamide dehydrogenase (E3) component
MNRKYDAIVIGAGQAGPFLAARFAGAGKSVAIIERHLFGGTCINTGCTPTKTLIASARIPTMHAARTFMELICLRLASQSTCALFRLGRSE